MDKKCWSCGSFERYYRQGYTGYYKADDGYCRKQRAVVDKNESCESWYRKTYRKSMHIKRASKILNEMLGTLQAIKEYMLNKEDTEIEVSDYLAVKSGE